MHACYKSNQSSQTESEVAEAEVSASLVSDDEIEDDAAESDLGLYGFRGFWLTLLVVQQSSHQSRIASSALNSCKEGPSTCISRRSESVLVFKLVLRSVLTIFRVEKILSTLALEKGKLNNNSANMRIFGHLSASGTV